MPSLQRVPMLVCLLIELNIKLTGGPANSGAVQVRAIEGVVENQKSESTGNAGYRGYFLILVYRWIILSVPKSDR